MDLFITDRASIYSPSRGDCYSTHLHGAAAEALKFYEIPDGMPFILDSKGQYEPILSNFLRSLPVNGCPSPNTWLAYGRDLLTLSRYLEEHSDSKALLQIGRDDIRRYYSARTISGSVGPTTWNRTVNAIQKFFVWAQSEGLTNKSPFTYSHTKSFGFKSRHDGIRNNAYARSTGKEVKCISLDDFYKFRDIGLLGQLPDGTLDPTFRGRNRLRNAAFAEFLVTTGLRLHEGASILRQELPDPNAAQWQNYDSCRMQLASVTAKGRKGRKIWIAKRVLRDYIIPYVQEERENAVGRAGFLCVYPSAANAQIVRDHLIDRCRLQIGEGPEKTITYNTIALPERRRMFTIGSDQQDLDPCLLWLTERGFPTSLNNIEVAFNRACRRLHSFGIELWVTPHTLRHTFAVYMLSHLIRETVGDRTTATKMAGLNGDSAYRRIIGDPLRTLQRLLGHSSVITTYRYLTYIEEAEELIDAAVSSWGDRAATFHPPGV